MKLALAEILREDQQVLLELQELQMYAGRDSQGDLITPGYLDDPFFKTPETAARYSSMKRNLPDRRDRSKATEVFGAKPENTPDLILTGRIVYDSLVVNVTNEALTILFQGQGEAINQGKYGGKLDGLSPEAWEWYKERYLRPKMEVRIRNHFDV